MEKSLPMVVLLLLPLTIQAWENWKPIFVGGSPEDENRLAQLVREQGWEGVLSPSLALVSFHDFSRFEIIPVSAISQRLHPTDPRWDPFLRNVPKLFISDHHGFWIYVHASRWNQGFGDWLGRHGFHWHQPGSQLEERRVTQLPLSIAAFSIFLFLIGLGVRRLLRPWLWALWGIGILYLCLVGERGLLSLYAASLFMVLVLDLLRHWLEKRQRDGPLKKADIFTIFTIPRLFLLIPAAGFVSLFTSEFLTVVVNILEFFLLLGVHALFLMFVQRHWRRKLSELEHRLFVPMELRSRQPGFRDRVRTLLALGTVLPSLLLSGTERVELMPPWIKVPRPSQLSGEESFEIELRQGIPGPRLFLAHLIFQEAFPYGVEFGNPEEKPLTQPFYRREGKNIREEYAVILPFDQKWREEAAKRGGALGLGNLIGIGDTEYTLSPATEVRIMTSPSIFPALSLLGIIVLSLLYGNPQFVKRRRSAAEGQQRRQAA